MSATVLVAGRKRWPVQTKSHSAARCPQCHACKDFVAAPSQHVAKQPGVSLLGPRVLVLYKAAFFGGERSPLTRHVLLTISLLCLALCLGAATAAADNYGAIAYSSSSGAHGWSIDYRSRAAAENAALANCQQHAADCSVPIWFRNACGALAVGSNGYGSGWGTSRSIAESIALRGCRVHSGGCLIRRWACTTR